MLDVPATMDDANDDQLVIGRAVERDVLSDRVAPQAGGNLVPRAANAWETHELIERAVQKLAIHVQLP